MRCDRGAGIGVGEGSSCSGKEVEVLEGMCGWQGVVGLLGTLCRGERGLSRILTVGSLDGPGGGVWEHSGVSVGRLSFLAMEVFDTGVVGRPLDGCRAAVVDVMR